MNCLLFRLGLPLLIVVCSAGCQEPATLPRYESVSGQVSSVDVDTGEIEIAPESGQPVRSGPVRCMWTKDSEAYINGRFSPLTSVAVGDPIRVLGYYEGGLDLPRLVATEIRIGRSAPPPTLPDFLKPPNPEESTNP